MSTQCGEEMFNIGARLRIERERLGLSQEGLGTRLATTGRTIKKYESNQTSIRATELLQFFGLGADVNYIITGERQPSGVSERKAPYSAAEHLGVFIASLTLSDDDASLLKAMALRLAR